MITITHTVILICFLGAVVSFRHGKSIDDFSVGHFLGFLLLALIIGIVSFASSGLLHHICESLEICARATGKDGYLILAPVIYFPVFVVIMLVGVAVKNIK